MWGGLGQLITGHEGEEVIIDDGSTGGGLVTITDPFNLNAPVFPAIPPRAVPSPRPVPHPVPPGANNLSGWLQTSTSILGVNLPNWLLAGIGITVAVVLAKGKK